MMELSTKGRYATRIMVALAMQGDETPVPKRAIADAEAISPDYAEQILIKLKDGGLVRSSRGIHGGFVLNRPADAITVLDVLESTEGLLNLAPCEKDNCRRMPGCVTRPVWKAVEETVRTMFGKTTIGELARKLSVARSSKGPVNYAI